MPFRRVGRWAAGLPETAWQTIEVRDGEKGPLVVQGARTLVQARSEGRVSDVVEWLVRFKFEPNFDEKHNELYLLGWKRLDDEVAGLASSKFASSAWKPEFRRALNARPKFVSVELPRGDLDRLFSACEACGRSGHPATWTVSFEGTAYHRKDNRHARFLEDVESDED